MIKVQPYLNFEPALGMRLGEILGEDACKFEGYSFCHRDTGLVLPVRPIPGDRIIVVEGALHVQGRLDGFIDLAGVVKEVAFVRRNGVIEIKVEMELENQDLLTSDKHRLEIYEMLVSDGWH